MTKLGKEIMQVDLNSIRIIRFLELLIFKRWEGEIWTEKSTGTCERTSSNWSVFQICKWQSFTAAIFN